jgi:hypothetical protein
MKSWYILTVVLSILLISVVQVGAITHTKRYTRMGYATEPDVLFDHTFTATVVWGYETGLYVTAYPLTDVKKAEPPDGVTYAQYMYGAHSSPNGYVAIYPVITESRDRNDHVIAAYMKHWQFASPGVY